MSLIKLLCLTLISISSMACSWSREPRSHGATVIEFKTADPFRKPVRPHDRKIVENAWILDVNREAQKVVVQTVTTKISIEFKVPKEEVNNFSLGRIAHVTFECPQESASCNLKKKFKLFVSGRYVEVIKVAS